MKCRGINDKGSQYTLKQSVKILGDAVTGSSQADPAPGYPGVAAIILEFQK